MGCHSDTGFEHQARGFYAQMIVPDSFNSTGFTDNKYPSTSGAFAQSPGWNIELSAPSVPFAADTDLTEQFHGVASERLVYGAQGTGIGGISNRGLGNAGMVFEEGKEYEGFIFAKLPESERAATVSLVVTLEDYVSKKILATQTLSVAAGSSFDRYNFSLFPSASTSCVDIVPGSDLTILCGSKKLQASLRNKPVTGTGHTCVRCGGQFKLSLTKPSSVLVNYAYLQPGQWGRVSGLPVLKSAANILKVMGEANRCTDWDWRSESMLMLVVRRDQGNPTRRLVRL